MTDAITDPQTQDAYTTADPNANAVSSASVGGDADNTRILARQTPSGVSRGVQQLGGPSLQADSGNKQITVTDTSVVQVLMGNQPTFGEGFYVTKSGIDATQATSPDDFIFNSNQDIFKIVKTITFPGVTIVNPTCNAGEVLNNILNIEFDQETPFTNVPAVVGYTQGDAGTYYPFPRNNFFIFDAQRYFIINSQIFASQTAVTAQIDTFVSCIGSSGGLTVTTIIQPFKIFVLQESAA